MSPVARPTPAEPKARVARSVTKAVAAMFTRLFPTRMVVRKRVMSWERSRKGPPWVSASSRTFQGYRVVKAVSLAEKKAEKAKRRTKRKRSPGLGAWDWARAREPKGRKKSHRLGGLSISPFAILHHKDTQAPSRFSLISLYSLRI